MATWMVLSGKFDAFHLGMGVISCAIVAFFSGDMLFPSRGFVHLPGVWIRFVRYIPWLIYQIMLATIHLLWLTLHPRMHELINPRIIKFRSRLNSEIAMFVFANSITLTPGTITVFTSILGTYTVHVIDEKSGDALPGEMEERVAGIFGE